jgi:hypothetical protein
MKTSTIKFVLFLVALAGPLLIGAQQNDPADTKAMVEAKNYIFKAQFADPQNGRNQSLTSEYDLTVKPGTVIAYLPYFGRTYVAPANPSEGGIKFTSTDFEYTLGKRKKHSWEIAIKPRDAADVRELNLTIFDNGTASLRVNSMNRQSITFRGYVTEGKTEKKAF